MGNDKSAILKTLLYGDIFDYPFKEEELFRFLIAEKRIDKKTFLRELLKKNEKIVFKNSFYCLKGRENIIQKRIKKEKESLAKLKKAQKITNFISIFPTVLLIGVSGALAMQNAEKEDDIDLFVIVKKNTLFVTRFFIVGLLKLMGVYRERGRKEAENKICPNMFLDERNLCFTKEKQNLYTAHEVAQIIPLFQRNNTYQRFIDANKWIKRFLPNSIDIKILTLSTGKQGDRFLVIRLFNILEPLFKKAQLYIIKKHITIETISDTLLAFHPFDYRIYVLKEYEKRLRKYKIE